MVGTLYFVYVACASIHAGEKADGQATFVQRASFDQPARATGMPTGEARHPPAGPPAATADAAGAASTGQPCPGALRPPVVGVSHYPLLDLAVLSEAGYSRLSVVKGPLPLALAEREAEREGERLSAALARTSRARARRADERSAQGLPDGCLQLPRAPRLRLPKLPRWKHRADIPESLLGLGLRKRTRAGATIQDCSEVEMPPDEDLDVILQTLRGRILFDHEIRRAVEERGGAVTGRLDDALQALALRGLAGRTPSVAIDRFGAPHCTRCGSREIVEATCSWCGSDACLHCTECASMGQARSCRPLYFAPAQVHAPKLGARRSAMPPLQGSGAQVHPSTPVAPPGSGRLPALADAAGQPPVSEGATQRTAPAETPGTSPLVRQRDSPDRPGDSAGLREEPGRIQACPPDHLQVSGGSEQSPKTTVSEVMLPFRLTQAQLDASRLFGEFVEADERRECLVFAVCGAGKTEVGFDAIAGILRRGGRALFAVPRSDVVAEVAPRISAAFPGARVVTLRGAVRERYQDADVAVATTHQVIRFYQAFDLVILDEADAFPYRGSRMLRHALRRATAPWGKTAYMTATPDPVLLKKAEEEKIALVRISARHHGHPLPEPVVMRTHLPPVEGQAAAAGSRQHAGGPALPREIIAVVEEAIQLGHKVFVFVPTVELSDRIGSMLAGALGPRCAPGSGFQAQLRPGARSRPVVEPASAPGPPRGYGKVASVHSRHPERDALREEFKAGRLDVLVTTTIMERGITVPNADVVVLYADFERIFDAGALIQMAGRAGRSPDYPCARVYFAAARITPSMRAAIGSIQAMNRHAAESGYLVATSRREGAV